MAASRRTAWQSKSGHAPLWLSLCGPKHGRPVDAQAVANFSRIFGRSGGFWARGEVPFNGRVARVAPWSPAGPTGRPPAGPTSGPLKRPETSIHKWGFAVLEGRVVRSGDSWKGHCEEAWDRMGDRDTREHKEQADALGCTSYASYGSTPLATVVYFMAACGILPLAIRHPRLPLLHPGRSTLLYCGMVFTVCTASQSLVWWDQGRLAGDSTAKWDDRLFAVQVIVMLLPQLFAPYVWLCAPVFRNALKDFAKYEALHASITSTPLTPRWVRRRRILAWFIVASSCCCSATILLAVTFLQGMRLRYSYFPAAFSSIMMQLLMTLFFTTHHYQLWEASKALNANLRQIAVKSDSTDLEDSRRQVELRAIHDSRRLWVTLRALYNFTDYCFMDVFQMIHLFLSLLLAVYMFHVFAAASVCFNVTIEVMFVVITLLQLCLITNGAHHGAEQMYGPVVRALDKLTMDTDDPQVCRTVSLFYQSVIACPAAISLSGFTSVGRPLFTSVISATVTYIVIMLQFQQEGGQALNNNNTDLMGAR